MTAEDRLDLGGRDVLPAPDDQFLEPAGDGEVSALVEGAQIAGVHEALGVHRAGRRIGVVQVLQELLIPPRADLARLADGDGLDRRTDRRSCIRRGAEGRPTVVSWSSRESVGLVADSTGASSVCPNRFDAR